MNTNVAKKFIEDIMNLWEKGQQEKIDAFYSLNLHGSLDQSQVFGLADVKHRMEYLRKHHEKQSYTILDCIASDNRIAIQVRYKAFDNKLNEPIDTVLGGFYTLDSDNKVEKVDIVTSKAFNYKEPI